MSIEALQQRLGYTFADGRLLRQALTHRSHGQLNNERLEFLGDSVLNCAVSSMLYGRFARLDEGDLSRLRSNLVKQQTLYEIAQRLEISSELQLGEGEMRSGGWRRPSILGDTLEAILGAVYLDGGFAQAQQLIERLYLPVLKSVDPKTLGKDAKTLLQEHLQGRKIALPLYTVVATHGAAHNQLFEVECAIPRLEIKVLGTGGSRRAAEQAAAKRALESALAALPTPVRRARARAHHASEVARDIAEAVAAQPLGESPDGPRQLELLPEPVPAESIRPEAAHAQPMGLPAPAEAIAEAGLDRPRTAARPA
jgi:ribonuclease III